MTINAVSRSFACVPSSDGIRYTKFPAGKAMFSEGFETGDLSYTGGGVFTWSAPNRTAVVSTGAKSGSYSLSFLYPGDGTIGSDDRHFIEQRYTLANPQRELWYRYWLRVPSTFYHNSSGTSVGSSTNNKLFALWMDGYSSAGDGPTVAWEYWPVSGGGSEVTIHWSEGSYKTAGSHIQYTPFISIPGDRGRWMELVMHIKASTSRTLPIGDSSYPYRTDNDGVIQMWRRWESEETFTKMHEVTTANIAAPAGGPNGFKYGYFMGYANSAFSSDTEWLLDDLRIATSNIWGLS